jgi:effector-binding domain-containing protein
LIARAIFLSFLLFSVPALGEDAFVSSAEPLGRTPSDLPVERVEMQSQLVVVEKMEGKLADAPALISKALSSLQEKLRPTGIKVAGPALAVFTAAEEDHFIADAMLPIPKALYEPVDGLVFGTSPAGKALRVIHKGPLTSLEDTYFEIQTFVEDQGLEIGNTTMERYITDPAKTAPKDMLTEIYVPLK